MKRLNILTLGVDNLKESQKFYEELFSWKPTSEDTENIVFFNQGGYILALFPKEELAKDANVDPAGSGFSGITLAHNEQSKKEVDEFYAKALSLGAEKVKEPEEVFWGGYSGYIKDPSGHLWEIAYNPFTKTLDNGFLDLPRD